MLLVKNYCFGVVFNSFLTPTVMQISLSGIKLPLAYCEGILAFMNAFDIVDAFKSDFSDRDNIVIPEGIGEPSQNVTKLFIPTSVNIAEIWLAKFSDSLLPEIYAIDKFAIPEIFNNSDFSVTHCLSLKIRGCCFCSNKSILSLSMPSLCFAKKCIVIVAINPRNNPAKVRTNILFVFLFFSPIYQDMKAMNKPKINVETKTQNQRFMEDKNDIY